MCDLICALSNEQGNNQYFASEARAAVDGHSCWVFLLQWDAADSHSGVVSCLPGAPRTSLARLFSACADARTLYFQVRMRYGVEKHLWNDFEDPANPCIFQVS